MRRVIAVTLLIIGLGGPGCSTEDAPAADAGPRADLRADRPGAADAARPDRASPDRGPDVFVPFSLGITVNKVPAAQNGSAPYTALDGTSKSFGLVVPTHGFTIDVTWAGSNADPSSLKIRADRQLGSGSAALAAGADLSSRFTRAKGGLSSWKLPASLALAPGKVTFTATLDDRGKQRSSAITVTAATRTFLLDPFRLEDTWVLVFSRDVAAISGSLDSKGVWKVSCSVGKNGVVDLQEDLGLLGLSTTKMLPACARLQNRGVTGTNAIMRAWLEQLILAATRKAYLLNADGSRGVDSVRMRILHEEDPLAPALSGYSYQKLQGGETSKNFSAISVGGGDLSKPFLGRSRTVDLRNLQNEDNLSPSYGVLSTNALTYLINMVNKDLSIKMLLRQLLGTLTPELGEGGKRVGEDPLDAVILAKGFDPAKASPAAAARYQKVTFAVELLGRLLGALTAHEMGHSLGLVPGGAPPQGLFGGETKAAFTGPRTTAGHIDTPGFNLMEAGPSSAPGVPLNIMSYLTDPRFNELNTAYLQGRLLLLPK